MMLVFLLFAGLQVVLAQRTITGKVSDNQGLPLIGVTVLVKGTTIGTTTDLNGNFSIQVPNDQSTLQLSYVGYTAQDIVVGSQATVSVAMAESSLMMNEVVVTALGIKRESKTLGYATAVVNQIQLTENRSSNTMGTLQGKVSGVNITQFGTGPAGSTRIRIRGNSAFQGANLPLLVINGVPIDNTRFQEGNADLGMV